MARHHTGHHRDDSSVHGVHGHHDPGPLRLEVRQELSGAREDLPARIRKRPVEHRIIQHDYLPSVHRIAQGKHPAGQGTGCLQLLEKFLLGMVQTGQCGAVLQSCLKCTGHQYAEGVPVRVHRRSPVGIRQTYERHHCGIRCKTDFPR